MQIDDVCAAFDAAQAMMIVRRGLERREWQGAKGARKNELRSRVVLELARMQYSRFNVSSHNESTEELVSPDNFMFRRYMSVDSSTLSGIFLGHKWA